MDIEPINETYYKCGEKRYFSLEELKNEESKKIDNILLDYIKKSYDSSKDRFSVSDIHDELYFYQQFIIKNPKKIMEKLIEMQDKHNELELIIKNLC